MKKILLLGLMGLMGLSGLRAQQCDTIDAFPWMPNFSGGLGCWESTGNGSWMVSSAQTIICYLNSGVTTTGYMTITTPHLRLDCDSSGLRLWWKDKRNYMYPNLKVMVLKEDGMRDTLYTADMGTSFTQHSVSLATYVGQTVRITFEVRLPSGGYDYRGALSDIGIYSQYLPLGTLTVPGLAVVGDSVQAVLSLSQGLSPISYSWHSAMLGDLVAADTLRMVYPSSGWDTLTVTASNAYGTLSRSAKLRVHECPTVATFPWREDFDGYDTASYNVCWTIDGWSHRNRGHTMSCYDEDGMYASYSQLMTSSTNGKYMLSPAITIPATGTEHLRLWVQSYNIPTVRISPTASLLPADFTDTLIVGSSTGNTMVWRFFDLAPYAGQTIRVGLFRQGTTPNVNTVQIDYDTLPVIYTEGPAKTATGTSTLLTAHLRHGASEGLHYTWTSAVGGIITTNALGDSAWVNYSAGFSSTEDTLTVVATNAFGADTVVKPLHIIDCTPATILPWSENFDDGLACWYRPQGSKFENSLHTNINQVHDSILRVPLRYDTLGSWIMSKEIHLPADTALLPRLFWTVGCSRDNYQTFYSLLVTDSYNWTDTTNYTHLITDSTVHTRSLYGADLMSLDLRPYAGRTIHLAIHNLHRSTNTTYLNFHSFEIRSTALPRLALASDDDPYYYYGDTATFVATLVEGSDSGLVYTWHSTLLDSTIVGDTLLRLCYGLTSGIDTVTVVATNAYGSDSASAVVASSIINEPTVYLVAEDRQFVFVKAEVGDTVVYCATRNRCVTTGMTYLFHSSLMDTTVTVATTADTVRLPMVYPVAGIDTFTVTLSNIHGTSQPAGLTMEVLDCPAVSVPYMEDFESMTISYVPDCWDGGFWVVQNNDGRGAYFFEISNDAMLISPLIDLPADSLGLQLSWVSDYTFYINADVPSKVLVSPTGGKRDEDFTDTLYTGALCQRNVTGSDSVLLDAYRGSQVRIAFPSIPNTTCLYDDIRIDYNRTAPQVSLDMPGTINLHDTVLFTATINACSPQGLSVSWHSTLMGTNLTPIPSSSGVGSEVQLAYAVAGVDTIMVIVANAYGADTAVAVVRVIDCSSLAVPYSEDFEGVTATLSSEQGNLADCWDYSWNGSNAAYAPHVITNDGYQYLSNLPSQALFMVAGNATGYGNQAEVLLPRFADSLQTLSIAFDYRKESANIGTLTVGYYDGDTFTALQTMTPQSQTYRRDTVSFASAIVPDGRIALRWTQASSWFAVAIDNVDVFHTPASFFVPQIAIAAPASVLLTDSATYSVTLNDRCSPEGLSFTWHSTLLDSTIVTTESILTLGYTAGGVDTVTVIASNAYGADTAMVTVSVYNCNDNVLPYVEDYEGVTPVAWSSTGTNALPPCWEYSYNGTTANIHLPTVVSSYQYINDLSSNALLMMAGNTSGYATWVQAELPLFNEPLSSLVLAFDYRYEHASQGTLVAGYYDDNTDTFYSVDTITPHTGNYLRDSVYFDAVTVPMGAHIALRWIQPNTWYAVVIDNIEVFVDNSIHAPADLTVDSVSNHCVTLSWQPVDSATAYHVTVTGIIDTTVASTAVTLCGLAINSQYTASVAAIVGGETGQGTSVAFSTPSLNPTMLYVDSVSSRCVGLSWSACSGALVYNVVIDGVVDTVVADTAVVICGLETQTQYTARVAGINGTDTGLYATVQFSTPCVIVDLPWFEDFQGSSPLACWSKRGVGYYGMQICTEYYWEDYCHSGSRGLQMYNYTAGNTLVVSTPVIEAPADELLVSFWVCNPNEQGGLLEAGVITDPTDSTTFVPLMQCMMTDTPTRYEFDTRNVTVSGHAALAFRTTAYCTAMIVDDINVEQISTCARLRSVGSNPIDARTAVVEWQYDTASAIPNIGVLVTLTDLIDSSIAPVVMNTTGNSHTFNGLSVGHRYLASVQALCTDDTSVALTTEVVPTGNPCAEVTGPYNSGWFLMNCDRPYSYSQSLYPAVLAASVDTLFGIAYRLTSSSVEQYPTSNNTYSSGPRLVDVYIGQTTNNTLTAPVSASNLTLAVQNYELPVSDTGWVHINFTTPVPLDGVSNLIVTLDDNTGAIYGDVEFGHHTADIGTCFRTSTSSYSYTQTYDPYNPTGFSPLAGTQIPDIQLLGGCSSDRCLQPIATVINEGEHSISLGWQQRGSETQWQVEYHIDGDSTWIVDGITSNTTYTVSGLNAGTGYRLRVASLCMGDTIYSDILSAHTQCGTVSLPYHQSFRNYDMPNNQSHISEGGIPCWQTGNITLLSQGRGLWNTHQNGDFIISPEIGINLSLVRVTLSASGSTFFNAGIKVGVCDSMGSNLVWLDTITLSDSAQDYIVHLNNYTGSDHHLAIGGSYESWTLYDVLLEQAANCLPVHHIALSHLYDESITFCWPPIDASHSWAVYLDGTLIGTTNDTSYALSGLTSNTEYHLGVREICAAGDTSEFTTLAVTTLCTTSLPYSEDFESYEHNSLPHCWYLDERPHTGSSHNAWILNSASTDGVLRMGDYYSPYEAEDTLANYICSPMLQVGNHSVSISFVASSVTINWGSCQVGIMTNAADTNSFIALATITPTISDTLYQLNTTGMTLPAKYALAFRWYGYTYCSVDDINVTIVPSYTISLAVNDTAMGSVSGAGTYEEGAMVTVTATPNPGYRFVVWSDSVTSATRQISLRNSDISLTAYFEPVPQYTVTVNAVMNDGSHQDGLDEMVHGAGTYADGDTVSLEGVVQGCDISFVYWITAEDDTLYDNPYTFVIHADMAITAVFAANGGIDNVDVSQWTLYPNPANGVVTIESAVPSRVRVFDITGREAMSTTVGAGATVLDISRLSKGVYFVRLGAAVKKLVVQ